MWLGAALGDCGQFGLEHLVDVDSAGCLSEGPFYADLLYTPPGIVFVRRGLMTVLRSGTACMALRLFFGAVHHGKGG